MTRTLAVADPKLHRHLMRWLGALGRLRLTMGSADATRLRVAETRRLADDARKARQAAHRFFERNLAIYREAEILFRHRRGLVVESRSKIERQIARRRRVLIGLRIDQGRLPLTLAPIVTGGPGFGGECAACDGYMPATQMVMAIPDGGTFVYLHADCYVIWKAQCHLRAALRRIV